MAAIPITIVGTLTGKATKEGDTSATEQVVIQGIASLTGLEVGGGPMPGGPPVGIWPSPGHPAHPIAPGGPPLGFWGGVAGPGVEHPIYIPITPPPDSGLSPEHPIYLPVYPSHPIAGVPTWEDIKKFLFGNLPPQPPVAGPV